MPGRSVGVYRQKSTRIRQAEVASREACLFLQRRSFSEERERRWREIERDETDRHEKASACSACKEPVGADQWTAGARRRDNVGFHSPEPVRARTTHSSR